MNCIHPLYRNHSLAMTRVVLPFQSPSLILQGHLHTTALGQISVANQGFSRSFFAHVTGDRQRIRQSANSPFQPRENSVISIFMGIIYSVTFSAFPTTLQMTQELRHRLTRSRTAQSFLVLVTQFPPAAIQLSMRHGCMEFFFDKCQYWSLCR